MTSLAQRFKAVREGRYTPLGDIDHDVEARSLARAIPEDAEYEAATLRAYAIVKTMAIGAREAGAILRALELEAQCERIFNQLPAGARW